MIQDFPNGILELPADLSAGGAARHGWTGGAIETALVIIAVALVVAVCRNLIRMAPYFFRSLFRWKENVEIEHDLHLNHDRGELSLVYGYCLCLIVARFIFFEEPVWLAFALIGGYMLIRHFFYYVLPHRKIAQETWEAAKHCALTYAIIMCILMLVAVFFGWIFKWSPSVAFWIVIGFNTAFFLLSLVRTSQILRSSCKGFPTFLYLCGLEIIPAACLVAAGLYAKGVLFS